MGISMLRFAPIYGGLLAILIVYLGYRVTEFRRKEKVGLEQSNCSAQMRCAIRAHANAVENVPIAVLLLLMLELNHLNPLLTNAFGVTLVFARLIHAWGVSHNENYSFGRFWGTLLTWLSIAGMALLNIVIIALRFV
jgi:uncharacterized protein